MTACINPQGWSAALRWFAVLVLVLTSCGSSISGPASAASDPPEASIGTPQPSSTMESMTASEVPGAPTPTAEDDMHTPPDVAAGTHTYQVDWTYRLAPGQEIERSGETVLEVTRSSGEIIHVWSGFGYGDTWRREVLAASDGAWAVRYGQNGTGPVEPSDAGCMYEPGVPLLPRHQRGSWMSEAVCRSGLTHILEGGSIEDARVPGDDAEALLVEWVERTFHGDEEMSVRVHRSSWVEPARGVILRWEERQFSDGDEVSVKVGVLSSG